MKSRLKSKIRRKYRQSARVSTMLVVFKAYEMYHMMQLHTSCVENGMTYEEAENFSNFMNNIFNTQTSPGTFITNSDEESNLAIEFYEKFQNLIRFCEDDMQQSIVSFCRSVYFGGNIVHYKVEGFMFYPFYLESVISHLLGTISFSQLRNSLITVKLWDKTPKVIDSVLFRKDFIEAERLFLEILNKRKQRLAKTE